MDWRLFLATFGAVFLAEMGDKTQLATMSLAATGSRWTVFAASALALVLTSAIAVLAGDIVARYISPLWIRRGAGALFVILGVMFLFTRPEAPADPGPETADGATERAASDTEAE